MRAFLTDTDKLKGTLKTLEVTSDELRELIYEADDLVMDCRIRAEYPKSKGSFSCCHLSSRELFFRYQTGKKLINISKQFEQMQPTLKVYLEAAARFNSEGSRGEMRRSSQVFKQSEIVGLTEDAKRIKGWILPRNKELHYIGIVGMGGLGKTTIAQKIFNDKEVKARFQERIWVPVSENANVYEILKSILKQLRADDQATSDLPHKICQVLSDKTYLIVLDDVWNIKNGWWETISIGLPSTEEHSGCIIITSRIVDVVKDMGVMETRVHQPKLLDEEEGWSLLCKVAFKSKKQGSTNSNLEKIGKEIVTKCGGLPLAIKAIGGSLSSKNSSIPEWDRICKTFRAKIATKIIILLWLLCS
ncbi:unnamed protein product [Ilex paraguariensis]|uniref:NB-ARC domain-containing protein n=1 Tax=Ilex paraguariensis TaxID=185542 RepID=A0ABC8TBD1_9AQUA